MGGNRLDQRGRRRSRFSRGLVGGAAAAVLLATVGIVADAGTAAALTPPSVVSSRVTPSTVAAGSTITFTWRAKSGAGVTFTSLFPSGPNFSFLGTCFGNGTLVSGSARSGTYRQACIVPTQTANGKWTTQIEVQDGAGQDISVAGPDFTVTGGLTTKPPTFGPSSANRTSVVAGHPITFTWQVDSPIGVADTSVGISGPDLFGQLGCDANGTLISGTATAGTYREVCVVPKASSNSTWTSFISAQDVADQSSSTGGPSFTVTGGTTKTTPLPQIGFSSVSPTTVATGQTVTFTWQVSAAAGVSNTSVEPYGVGGGISNVCFGNGTLISGTARNGTYQEPCTIPTDASSGGWMGLIAAADSTEQSTEATGPAFTVVPIQITTTALPAGLVKTPYGAVLSAIGGSSQYQWSLAAGSLPPGLSLGVDGVIRGRPQSPGTYTFTVRGAIKETRTSLATPGSATQVLSITVN